MTPERERALLLISLGKAVDRIADARCELEPFDAEPEDTPLERLRWDFDNITYATELVRKARRHLAAAAEALHRLEAAP